MLQLKPFEEQFCSLAKSYELLRDSCPSATLSLDNFYPMLHWMLLLLCLYGVQQQQHS
ncbi:uncharacterized protein LOC108599291 isoform X2 [Drosophila busckii]|uniref:uncharacterized protein LOC108599291 isoform X2 n=1 Tax=Drosophila busckii TaxID=30019 RepID=UPI00083ED166|nr:uncharacterized protein LOC108599291 isoform X2 [Drosophila busckii]